MLKHSSCLRYALDKCHTEGGSLVFGKSTHWGIAHAMHLSEDQRLTHFVPLTELRQPWHSLFGFDGHVVSGDTCVRGPMSKKWMFIGSIVLMIFGAVWASQDTVKRIFRRFWMTDIDAQIKAVEDALQDRRARDRRKADRRMTAGTTQQHTDQGDILLHSEPTSRHRQGATTPHGGSSKDERITNHSGLACHHLRRGADRLRSEVLVLTLPKENNRNFYTTKDHRLSATFRRGSCFD